MTKLEEKIPLGEVTGNYPTMKETGEFIRHARESHGISQETLGNKIYVTRKAVSKWETGVGYPSVEILAPLAEALNISIDEMLIGNFNKKEENSDQKGLINYILRLSKRKYIRRTVKLILAMLFLLLAIFFVTNYNAVTVYKLGYIGDDFYVQNGIVVTTRSKEYINIGFIGNDFKDVDKDTTITYTLYIGDENNILTELEKFSVKVEQPILSNANYKEIPKLNITKNFDNLYIKVEYVNNTNKTVVFIKKLRVELKYKSNDYFNYKKEILNPIISNKRQLISENIISNKYIINIGKIHNNLLNNKDKYLELLNKEHEVRFNKNLIININGSEFILDFNNMYLKYKNKISDKPTYIRLEKEYIEFNEDETKTFKDLIKVLKLLEKDL